MSMTMAELERLFQERTADLVDTEPEFVDLDQGFEAAEASSLDAVQIIAGIMRAHRIQVPREKFDGAVTIREFARILFEHQE